MTLKQLELEMNRLSVKNYLEVQALFRKHRGILDDRKATLALFKYISDFIGLGWKGHDKVKVIENLLAVQKSINTNEKRNEK